jgi:hypothetical protein
MYKLLNEVVSAKLEGRDLLGEMAAELDSQIEEERKRLDSIRNL